MNTPSAKMLVLVGEQLACIRIIGRANFTSSVDFKTLVDELRQKGCNCFVLDLSECVLMDSTFLGVLAGLGLKLSDGNGSQGRHGVELFNPSPRITELLETLGVLHLFKIAQGNLTAAAPAQSLEYTPGSPSKTEVTRTCIEAHETLMALSPANAARFKDVTQFLAEGLKKSKTEESAPPVQP
jgi:anti-sigma B factor antagonist